MLVILGFLMVATFMYLIMSKRATPVVGLILVPVAFGLIALPLFHKNALRGTEFLLLNAEYRSVPLALSTVFVGFAVFFDSGNAADRAHDLFPLQSSAGFGLRVMLPQFNREVLRADAGFPLTPGAREIAGAPVQLTLRYGQAF